MDKYAELRAALEAYDPDDTSTWADFWDHVTLPTIRALLAERDALAAAAQEAINLLGPDAPDCSGCDHEWNAALRVLKAAPAQEQGD